MLGSAALRIAGAWLGASGGVWSYRFLPFELSWFFLGSLAYLSFAAHRAWCQSPAARPLAAAGIAMPLIYAAVIYDWKLDGVFDWPRLILLLAVAGCIPALHGQTRRSAVDRRIGEFSYPLYLGHYIVVMIATKFLPQIGQLQNVNFVLVVSLALSWAVLRIVDLPLNHFRQRKFGEAQTKLGGVDKLAGRQSG